MVPIRQKEPRVDEAEEASVSAIEENKALVRRFFEAQNRGDLAAAVEGRPQTRSLDACRDATLFA
jgi:hypothetical protein